MVQPISILRAFALVWAVALCPLSVLLLASAATAQGIVFGVGGLLLGIAPLLAWLKPENTWMRRGALAALVTWLGITIWLYCESPDGRPRRGARVENRYVGGDWQYQRQALGAILPEEDQFMLGFRVIPLLDPLLTFDQTRPLANDTRAIYTELEADADFHGLGSVMPDAYSELWGLPFNRGHYFLYVPPSFDRKTPAPALVFVHGSGGNFKSYTWLLSQVADERGMVLIAPSSGFGNWDAGEASGIVVAALEDAAKSVPIDMGRVHLAGLSNGGLGVSRTAASEFGGRFRSLILFSSVCDQRALESATFLEHWHAKPVLVITGENDDRVPLRYVQEYSEGMREAGVAVEINVYPQANHFLFFSHRERCLKDLSDWLAKLK